MASESEHHDEQFDLIDFALDGAQAERDCADVARIPTMPRLTARESDRHIDFHYHILWQRREFQRPTQSLGAP